MEGAQENCILLPLFPRNLWGWLRGCHEKTSMVSDRFWVGDAARDFYSRIVAKSERTDCKLCDSQSHGAPINSRGWGMFR